MEVENLNVVFRMRSMCDYHEDRIALIDLFKRCELTNQMSKSGLPIREGMGGLSSAKD